MDDNAPPVHMDLMGFQTAPFDTSAISPADAQHALWVFAGGSAAIRPGLFMEHLMLAIAHADSTNRPILSQAFPGPAAAIALATGRIGGTDALEGIALRHRSVRASDET